MAQSKKGSLLEVTLNMLTGFLVAWTLTYWFFPKYFGLTLSGGESWVITAVYTVASVIRSYVWRRVFNAYIIRQEAVKRWKEMY